MTKKLYSMFAMLGLFFVLAVSSAQAQSSDLIKVNVPFDFQVSGKTLPAGEYAIKRVSEKVLLIRNAEGKGEAMVQAPSRIQGPVNKQERLVFHQYGDQYFLSQVWLNRQGDGRELNRSSEERRAAAGETLAANGKKLRKIEVAAHAR